MLKLLQSNAPFRRLMVGLWVSGLGNSLNVIALSLALYAWGGVASVGAMWGVRVTSRLLLGPWLGVLADRWDRRRLLLWGSLANAATALALVWCGPERLWLALLLTLLLQTLDGLCGPALGATLPRLVQAPDLPAANALSSLSGKLTGSLGPAVAGLVYARWGASPLFVVNGLSFLAVVWAVWPLRLPALAAARPPFWQDAHQGWRLLATLAPLRLALGLGLLCALTWRVAEVALLPLTAPLGSSVYGLLFAALTLGGAAGALLMARWPAGDPERRMGWSLALCGPLLAALGLWPSLPLGLAALFSCGVLLDLFGLAQVACVQRSVPSERLGQAWALLGVALALGALPVLGLAPLLNWLGAGGTLALAGGLLLLALPVRRAAAAAVVALAQLKRPGGLPR